MTHSQPTPAQPVDPLRDTIAVLPSWTLPGRTVDELVDDIRRRGWTTEQAPPGGGKLTIHPWLPHQGGEIIIGAGGRRSISGIVIVFQPRDLHEAVEALRAAWVTLWGQPSDAGPLHLTWTMPAWQLAVTILDGLISVGWSSFAGSADLTGGTEIDAMIAVAGEEPGWMDAIRAAQRILNTSDPNSLLTELAALFVHIIAKQRGISPDRVPAADVMNQLNSIAGQVGQPPSGRNS